MLQNKKVLVAVLVAVLVVLGGVTYWFLNRGAQGPSPVPMPSEPPVEQVPQAPEAPAPEVPASENPETPTQQ